MQQAGKQIVDTDIQGHSRHDVVCFTAVNDVAGFIPVSYTHLTLPTSDLV